jgi:hypothetical protein
MALLASNELNSPHSSGLDLIIQKLVKMSEGTLYSLHKHGDP